MRLLLIETKPVAESGGAAGDVVPGATGSVLQDAAGGATEVAANGDYAEGDYAEGDNAEGDYHYKSNGGRTCKYKGFLSLDGHRLIMNIFLCICLSLCACKKIVHLRPTKTPVHSIFVSKVNIPNLSLIHCLEVA